MSACLVTLEVDRDPQEVVARLQELLDRAKAGEIESFVAVMMRYDGKFFTRSSGYKNALELLGALACVQHDIITATER